MRPVPQPYDNVVLTVPVTIPYARQSNKSPQWYIGSVLREMLSSSKLQKTDIDGLALASFNLRPDSAAIMAGYYDTEFNWVLDLSQGGASGVLALKRAARAVQAGDAAIVACIGADTMAERSQFRDLIKNYTTITRDYTYDYGAAGPSSLFAMKTRYYMERYGATREDFGRICIAQREAAGSNPYALLRETLTMEDYLNAREVSDPLRLFDCVMPCNGAEGFLVMSRERAQHLGMPAVALRAAIECHNAYREDEVQYRAGWARHVDAMYDAAGLGPADMSFLQAYDDYPVMVMIQMEDLGFCAKGEGPEFVRRTPLGVTDGGLALNTCGGQLSVGQAGAAGGFLGVVEGIRQLSGQTLGIQVASAKAGIVSGYGQVNYDRGICTAAAVLEALH